MRARLLFIGLASIGCVAVPTEGEIEIRVTPRQADPTADGHGQADLHIVLDEAAEVFRREVHLEVSSGTIGGADDPRRIRLKSPPSGEIVLPWRYGTAPGRATVEVRVADYTLVDDSLLLAPQLPDRVTFTAEQTTLVGDGRGQARLGIVLAMDQPGRSPSDGTVIHLVACCGEAGAPVDCTTPPIAVSAIAIASGDAAAQVIVHAARLRAPDDPEPGVVEAFVLASAEGPPGCARPDDPRVARQRLAIEPGGP